MKIHCLTTFLDGVDRFERGDVRTVDDERAARFIAAGWATDQSGQSAEPTTGEASLTVHNSALGLGDSNG